MAARHIPDEVLHTNRKAQDELLRRPGITAVGVGFKEVGGELTETIAIRVHVTKKRDVPADQAIPREIDGVPTDVIEQADVQMADTNTYSTLRGGISTGPCDVPCFTAGTLGCVVVDRATGKPMMLSNHHVLCYDDDWEVGNTVLQPGKLDTGNAHCDPYAVGKLSRGMNADYKGTGIDAAVAELTRRDWTWSIEGIGSIQGYAEPVLDLDTEVRKRGRTTGLTSGYVVATNIKTEVTGKDCYGNKTTKEHAGQFTVRAKNGRFIDSGDSGSVIVDSNNKVIGLLHAGPESGERGTCTPIGMVMEAMDIRIPYGLGGVWLSGKTTLSEGVLRIVATPGALPYLAAPALTIVDGKLALAWTGGDPFLNVATSTDGVNFTKHVIYSAQSLFGPALAHGNGRSVLAWTGSDKRLNIATSTDLFETIEYPKTLGETSTVGPALFFDGRYFVLAWTGEDQRLNTIHTNDPRDFPSTNKVSWEEKSKAAPGLDSYNGKACLVWQGLDDRLNRGVFSTPVTKPPVFDIEKKRTLDETSAHRPTLVMSSDGVEHVLWTGMDNYGHLNARFLAEKYVYDDKSNASPAACLLNGAIYVAWAGLDGRLNIARLAKKVSTDW